MVSIVQLFEFSYPNGFLFYDRSGILSRRLQEFLPGLSLKSSSLDQRDFVLRTEEIDLLFGVALSGIQTLLPDSQGFASTATKFLQIVTETLEITHLKDFRFRHVLGKPCKSDEEAQELMAPLIPEEAKAKMRELTGLPNWSAVQGEFRFGNLSWQSRTAIVYLIPHEKLRSVEAKSGLEVPHITVQLEARGLAPIDLAKFDAEAFINNIRENLSREIISKLSPHLA